MCIFMSESVHTEHEVSGVSITVKLPFPGEKRQADRGSVKSAQVIPAYASTSIPHISMSSYIQRQFDFN